MAELGQRHCSGAVIELIESWVGDADLSSGLGHWGMRSDLPPFKPYPDAMVGWVEAWVRGDGGDAPRIGADVVDDEVVRSSARTGRELGRLGRATHAACHSATLHPAKKPHGSTFTFSNERCLSLAHGGEPASICTAIQCYPILSLIATCTKSNPKCSHGRRRPWSRFSPLRLSLQLSHRHSGYLCSRLEFLFLVDCLREQDPLLHPRLRMKSATRGPTG